MTSQFPENSLNKACANADPADLSARIDECEQRIASLMWVLGVIRRGVDWQEDSPILRVIEQAMSNEEARGDTLGPNVARMTFRRASPPAAFYSDCTDQDFA